MSQNARTFESALAFLQSLQGAPAYALLFVLLFSCGIGAPIPLIVVSRFGLVPGGALIFR